MTETYYISTSHSGLETNEFYLPFPKKNAPGDWYYFEGNEWMDRIHLHTIPSIISTGIGLNRMLFRAEYRGEMEEVPTYIMMDKSTGFGIWRLDLTLGEIITHEVRLIAHVETWNIHTARLFAFACAEKVLNEVQSIYQKYGHEVSLIEQHKLILLGRREAFNDLKFLSWKGYKLLSFGEEVEAKMEYFSEIGNDIRLWRKELEQESASIWELVKENKSFYDPSPLGQISMAAQACTYSLPYHAANDATSYARKAKMELILLEHMFRENKYSESFWGDFKAKESERWIYPIPNLENIESEMTKAWFAELVWQSAHLSELLGENGNFPT